MSNEHSNLSNEKVEQNTNGSPRANGDEMQKINEDGPQHEHFKEEETTDENGTKIKMMKIDLNEGDDFGEVIQRSLSQAFAEQSQESSPKTPIGPRDEEFRARLAEDAEKTCDYFTGDDYRKVELFTVAGDIHGLSHSIGNNLMASFDRELVRETLDYIEECYGSSSGRKLVKITIELAE